MNRVVSTNVEGNKKKIQLEMFVSGWSLVTVLDVQMRRDEPTTNDCIRRHLQGPAVDSPTGVSLTLLSSDISVPLKRKKTLRVTDIFLRFLLFIVFLFFFFLIIYFEFGFDFFFFFNLKKKYIYIHIEILLFWNVDAKIFIDEEFIKS